MINNVMGLILTSVATNSFFLLVSKCISTFEVSSMNIQKVIFTSLENEAIRAIEATPKIIAGLIVFVFFWILARFMVRATRRFIRLHPNLEQNSPFVISVVHWVTLFVGFSITLHVVGLGSLANKVLAGGGILAVALGFAFKEIGENLIAGFMLMINRPFNLKDLIRSGEHEGVVTNINLRHTHIRSIDGRDIFIPSSQIFKETLINYTFDGLMRSTFSIGVDYKEDLLGVIQQIQSELEKIDGVLKKPAPSILIAAFSDAWITLNVHFWVDTFNKKIDILETKNQLMLNVKEALLRRNVTLSCDTSSNLNVYLEKGD